MASTPAGYGDHPQNWGGHAKTSPHGFWSKSSFWGFALVEIVIVMILLGVLAALVGPRFANAANIQEQTSLRGKLRVLRTQIYVYRAEHHGVPPGYPRGDRSYVPTEETFIAQLTQYTNAAGDTSPAPTEEYRFGPYLERIPDNPLNSSDQIRLMTSKEQFPAVPAGDQGWVYQPSTGLISANSPGSDMDSVPYTDY